MKLKYVIVSVIVAFVIGVFLPSQCGDSDVAYHKGRADRALEDLQQAEEVFKEAVKRDTALQEEKDKRIAELEEEIAEEEQVIIVEEEAIVVTREMLKASGLYQGLVIELDEKWAAKYATLESIVKKERQKNREWQEKFDSKVRLAVEGWIEQDLAQKEVIKELQGRCVSAERKLKRSKFWGWVGKGFTAYHAAKGGYNLLKESL